jgi:hypothetical protein
MNDEIEANSADQQVTSSHREERLVRPDRIRMLQDWKFVGKTRGRSLKATIFAGEVGEYFAHSYCYTFRARRGWVPYFRADKIIANPEAWESLPNNID